MQRKIRHNAIAHDMLYPMPLTFVTVLHQNTKPLSHTLHLHLIHSVKSELMRLWCEVVYVVMKPIGVQTRAALLRRIRQSIMRNMKPWLGTRVPINIEPADATTTCTPKRTKQGHMQSYASWLESWLIDRLFLVILQKLLSWQEMWM